MTIPNFTSNLKQRWPQMEDDLLLIFKMKTTSYGRQPQTIKSVISQQPLIGSFSNFKLKVR